VFEKLGKQQLLIISVLTGCSYDDNSIVSSSAVRALAVYALFPSLRIDMCFLENTIELILRITTDSNVSARSKAMWAMGNIIDALLLTNGLLRQELLVKIIQENLKGIGDNDRVRINAARTLGNIFTLLNEEQIKNKEILDCFQQSISSLTTLLLDCNNDKLKWNICYAFTNVMKNSMFFESTLVDKKWKELVFPAMFKTITNSSNFKVRINACVAFKNVNRTQLGNYFIETWNCLLVALEKSTELTDFNEYKHRDELQDRICLSICHLIEISTFEDISSMKSQIVPIFDITKQNWNRLYNRWSPEDQGNMLSAISHFEKLSIQHSSEEKSIKFLINCFKPIEFNDH
jgi:HEAT repeat-containing protein 6